MWKLELVEEVREWLHTLRRDDRELSHQVADVIQTVLSEGPGLGRPLVDTLSGSKAKAITLKEMRAAGTIRIAFVYHGGTLLLLLASGDKRGTDSAKFYDTLIDQAVSRYDRWLDSEG
jgi:hypothetical protein